MKKDGKEANAKSIISVLSLGASFGSEITIIADGPDAEEAVAGLVELLDNLEAVSYTHLPGTWSCSACGATGQHSKFCSECGAARPLEASGWKCASCGALNKGKFCSECGAKKPEGALLYRCDKCGWEPDDPAKPPKFCPECGTKIE